MTLSAFAYTVGLIELIVAIPFIISPNKTIDVLRGMIAQDALMRVVGMLIAIMCFLVLKHGAEVSADWPGFVRLIAWLGGIKGVIYCWYPEWMKAKSEVWFNKPMLKKFGGFLSLAVGILLLKAGGMVA